MGRKDIQPEIECDADLIIELPFFNNQQVTVWHDAEELKKFGTEEFADASYLHQFLDREDFSAAALRENRKDGSKTFVLFFPGGDPKIRTAVHEAIHTVDDILDHLDIPISAENVEVRCYLTDYIVSRLEELYGW